MGERRSTVTGRRWAGRVVRLMMVPVAGFAGAGLGVFPYLDLSEGPFVRDDSAFEQVGWNPGDCYWSPEAAEVDDRLAQMFVGVPVVLALLVASGFAFAVWRRSTTPPVPPSRGGSAAVDAALACLAIAAISGIAVGVAHGFTIGRLLDPGCVGAGVPGLPFTVVAESAALIAAAAVGIWLERASEGRRRARITSQVKEPSPSTTEPAFPLTVTEEEV